MKKQIKLAMLLAACAFAYSQEKPSPNFTGGEVKPVKEGTQASIVKFNFGAGARTKWHSHSGGQIIMVEDGVALYQEKGGPVVEMRAGETHYCPPNVVHWHGAAPHEGGTQFNVTRGDITWGDVVTDAEYNAKPVHK
ncbi:MAG TPA: cupin domain-containing protein [Bryobacteraceae bacterium]|nr:cupin domain-containing protein [Bryobacteraceae bacterium]